MKRNIQNDSNSNTQKRPCVAVSCKTEETSHCSSNIAHNNTPFSQTIGEFLRGVNMYILQAGIGKTRAELFQKQLKNYGGNVLTTYDPTNTTHILVDEKMNTQRMCRIMKLDKPPHPEDVLIVTSLWLSSCLKTKELVDTKTFELDLSSFKPESKSNMCNSDLGKETKSDKPTAMKQSSSPKNIGETAVPSTSKEMVCNDNKQEGLKVPKVGVMFNAFTKRGAKTSSGEDSDYEPSGGEEDKEEHLQDDTSESAVFKHKYLPKGSWICAQSSSQSRENYNKHITDKLEALAQTYENTNDKWRALGYQKGIIALKRHPKEIKTWEEAKNLPGVGQRLADKIWEIIESGELRKLNELSGQEEVKAINLFANVWGAGTVTARSWVQLGFRTLEDLRTKANLTYQQRIGLRYYEDILDRMPHEEAAEIEATVCEAVRAIDPSLVAMACGSFRRGKVTCGDVDVLVTHPDGKSHKGVFQTLLKNLHATGFLTDDLVNQDEGAHKKYLGVCQLPGRDRKHRRLDIIVVPYSEFACALMYFTGSAHFNRSMRHLAGKMGMSLTEHSLNAGVVRRAGEKLNEGHPLPTPTEESIFKHLGLPYRAPIERDH